MAEASRQGDLDLLWSGYASKWRRLFSRRAISELELRASFDVDTLSAWRFKNAVEPGAIPDCQTCPDICCRGLENVVSLRLVDIARLIDAGRTDVISRKKPNFPAHLLRRRPGLAELVSSELWRTLPVLRQEGPERACAALTKEMTCGLYPSWPTSCERFPYTLSAVRRRVVWGTRCPSRQSAPKHRARSEQLYQAALAAYDERVKDAVLLWHARKELDEIGIGEWLIQKGEDPFEKRTPGLPIIE